MAKQTRSLTDLDALLNEEGIDTTAPKKAKAKINIDDLLAGIELDPKKKKKLLAGLDALLASIELDDKEEEPIETIRLDLAPCAGMGLTHVGITYMHGGIYKVPGDIARDLMEMQRRGHSHEASITKQETKGRRRMNLDATTPITGQMAQRAAGYGF